MYNVHQHRRYLKTIQFDIELNYFKKRNNLNNLNTIKMYKNLMNTQNAIMKANNLNDSQKLKPILFVFLFFFI